MTILATFLIAKRATAAPPTQGQFGLGLVLLEPTSLNGIYWNSKDTAIDFGVALFTTDYLSSYGDYLWHFPGKFGKKTQFVAELNPYIGAGGGLFTWNNRTYFNNRSYGSTVNNSGTGFYGRMPLGIEWNPKSPSIGAFVEFVPELVLGSGLGLSADLGIGARYYF